VCTLAQREHSNTNPGASTTRPNSYAAALQGRAPGCRPKAAGRQGRRHTGAYVDPEVARQHRVLAAQEDTSTQALIKQPIELLFQAHRRGGGVG